MAVGQYARADDVRCRFVIPLTDSVPAGRLLNAKHDVEAYEPDAITGGLCMHVRRFWGWIAL